MDKRHGRRADDEVIAHFLTKHRTQLQREENTRRNRLRELTDMYHADLINGDVQGMDFLEYVKEHEHD